MPDMRSDLIAMVFDCQIDTQRVYDAIQSMRHSPILGLDKAIIVTRDSTGKTSLYQRRDVPTPPEAKDGDVLGLIADLLFGAVVEERMAAWVKAGLDEQFREGVVQAMETYKSALLTLVRYDDIADRDEFLRILTLFKGRVHSTTISAKAEAAVIKLAVDLVD
jgi:uncharacterized membrane protein